MPQNKYQQGFTLIELLVVVSIIALLIALLLPALGQAQASARAANCLSNMRQMAIAATNYAAEHKQQLPGIGFSHGAVVHDEQASWFYELQGYADAGLMARCPDDQSPHFNTPEPISGRLRQISYGTNYYVSGSLPDYEQYINLDKIPQPELVSHAFEIAERGEYAVADHAHPESLLIYATDAATLRPEAAEMIEINQHNEKSTWNFLDGHAEILGVEQTLLLDPAATLGDLIWDINLHDPKASTR